MDKKEKAAKEKAQKKFLKELLSDPDASGHLQELLAPLLQAASEPKNPLHRFLKIASEFITEQSSKHTRNNTAFQQSDARANKIMLQMKTMTMAEFLQLDPIDPYTLLLVAYKVNEPNRVAVEHSKNFKGRKKGATQALTKAIVAILEKNLEKSTPAIWEELHKNPPLGMRFVNHDPKHIKHDSDDDYDDDDAKTKYKTFTNIVSIQKRIIKNLKIPE